MCKTEADRVHPASLPYRTLYDSGPTIETLGEWTSAMLTDLGLSLWTRWARESAGDDLGVVTVETHQIIDDINAVRPAGGLHGLADTLGEWIDWAEGRRVRDCV